MIEKEVVALVQSSMGEKRFRHTKGCVKMAEQLAKVHGADISLAIRAAWLHDIAKEIPYDEQLKIAEDSGVILNDIQKSPKVIHAFTGAVIAKEKFGECEDVCNAIRWHTTAKSNMTLLEKIIWLADLIEEGRSFPEVEKIRSLALEDIGVALVFGFDTTIRFLLEQGSKIDVNMINARNYEIDFQKKRRISEKDE